MTKEEILKSCANGLSEDINGNIYQLYDVDKLFDMITESAIDEKHIKLLEEDRDAFIAFCHNIINGMFISVEEAAQEQLEYLTMNEE